MPGLSSHHCQQSSRSSKLNVLLNKDVHHPEGPQEGSICEVTNWSLALQLKSPQVGSVRSSLWKQKWRSMTDSTRLFLYHLFSIVYYRCWWAVGRVPCCCSACPLCSALFREKGNIFSHPKCPELGRPQRKEREDSKTVGALVFQENLNQDSDFLCEVPWRNRI